eukprot:3806701-Alexandrium_andersonii.AAC.1
MATRGPQPGRAATKGQQLGKAAWPRAALARAAHWWAQWRPGRPGLLLAWRGCSLLPAPTAAARLAPTGTWRRRI